jgi:hypothetical protein
MIGDPPRRFVTHSMRRICAPGARCDYLAHRDMSAPCSFPQKDRGAVLEPVSGIVEDACGTD